MHIACEVLAWQSACDCLRAMLPSKHLLSLAIMGQTKLEDIIVWALKQLTKLVSFKVDTRMARLDAGAVDPINLKAVGWVRD